MKAILKPVKVWMPHHEPKDFKVDEFPIPGAMSVYVGSMEIGWVEPVSTEPEELFKLHPFKLLYLIDWNDSLSEAINRKAGKPLQEILDTVELVMKDFLNKICV